MQRHTHTTRRRRSAVRLLAGALALAAGTTLLAACGDDATPTATAPPTTPISDDRPTTTVPSPTVVPAPDDDRGDDAPVEEPATAPPAGERPPVTTVPRAEPGDPVELEDGRHFGYLVGYELDSHATAASFDLAQLFTGDAADEAAAQDGAIAPGGQIENDVYIRNVSSRLRRALFRDDAAITVVDCSAGCTNVPGDRATLQNRPTPTPVWLTVAGGVVVEAEEVYLP